MSLNKSLRSKKEFDLVYKKGRVVSGIFFSLRFLESKNSNEPIRAGIVLGLNISKKAVLRNRKRRQLREIIRLNQSEIKKGYWLIISAREKILNAEYGELEKEFLRLCEKARLIG
jgi:ribonuclease P protein component